MQIELNLDEMTERYVRSLETRAELYRARTWTLFAAGILIGILLGMSIAVRILQQAGTV